MSPHTPEISLVIPALDERESLPELHASLRAVLDSIGRSSEIVYVDDGSSDGTLAYLRQLADEQGDITVVQLARSVGKAAALSAGFDHARGNVLVTMDADLQDDPREIPRLLAAIEEGYDAVSGWRRERHDRLVDRRVPSILANRLIAMVTRVPVHDQGCGLKAYRRELIVRVRPRLRGGMHRFLMVLCARAGGRVSEVVVNHRPRRFGRSKYGLSRIPRVLVDLAVLELGWASTARAGEPDYVVGELVEPAREPRPRAEAPSTLR